ncbi:EamA family transporter [Aquabacter sp. L1I39]|uniref:EamA family transporter n=1 Tax=Aquabacter sp. L1I39 TaxID=2820278 RepID=UPI001ADB439B|nr:EamA family transporter [Aquabacter sp. L1I39]QTL01855.1 EamA family transporter [Aquabacter sp. L1I39]
MPASTQRGVWLALLAVFVAMCCMQIGAALGKLIFPLVGAAGASALRILFASLILLAVFRPWRALPKGNAWRPLLLYGATLGFMNLFYYLAIARIPIGIAVALEFLGPLTVAVLNSRKPSDWLYVALAVVGVAILLPIHGGADPLDALGVVLAILAGACWGLYIVFGQRTSAVVPAGTATAIGMVIACCVVLPVGIAQSGAALLTPHILPIAVGIALLSSAIPYSLEMMALKRLPAQTFSILMSGEPACAALSGFLILGERLSLSQWIAIACVMAASIGSSLSARNRAPPAAPA